MKLFVRLPGGDGRQRYYALSYNFFYTTTEIETQFKEAHSERVGVVLIPMRFEERNDLTYLEIVT